MVWTSSSFRLGLSSQDLPAPSNDTWRDQRSGKYLPDSYGPDVCIDEQNGCDDSNGSSQHVGQVSRDSLFFDEGFVLVALEVRMAQKERNDAKNDHGNI